MALPASHISAHGHSGGRTTQPVSLNRREASADCLDVESANRVEAFLAEHAGQFYCGQCLHEAVSVLNPAQVGQIMLRLRSVMPYRHCKTICAHCGGDGECIAYLKRITAPHREHSRGSTSFRS